MVPKANIEELTRMRSKYAPISPQCRCVTAGGSIRHRHMAFITHGVPPLRFVGVDSISEALPPLLLLDYPSPTPMQQS